MDEEKQASNPVKLLYTFDTLKMAMFTPCWINFCGRTVKYSVNSDKSHDKKTTEN